MHVVLASILSSQYLSIKLIFEYNLYQLRFISNVLRIFIKKRRENWFYTYLKMKIFETNYKSVKVRNHH